MSAAWQLGPSYSPFSHTSNSQYGAWSGSGYGGGSSVPRKVGGAYVPTPPAPRVSEVTARDVAKIVSAADPVSGATKEKFTDFMSRYGTGRITPLTSQYDRVLAIHDAATPKRRTSHTPGNSPEPDMGSSSIGRAVHNEIIKTAKNLPISYSSSQRYGTYPRSKDSTSQETRDFQFQRSHSNVESQVDSVRRYSDMLDVTPNMKRTDSNNNVLHSNGYRTEPSKSITRPGLNRSNTFNGMPSQNDGIVSRYSDSRVGLDNLFTNQKRDLLKSPDSRYLSPNMRTSGTVDTTDSGIRTSPMSSPRDYQSQVSSRSGNGDTEFSGREYGTRDSRRDSILKSHENGSDARNQMYWLYGNSGRSEYDRNPSTVNPTTHSVTPYRPGEYLMKLEADQASARQYSHLDDARRDYSSSQMYREDSTLGSYSERSRYAGMRPATPYTNPQLDDPYGLEATFTGSEADLRAPEVISRHPGTQRSILKKGTNHRDSGSSFGAASSYHDTYASQYRNTSLGVQDTKQLPPLSSYTQSSTLKAGTTGKKVTFNLAKNKFRAILD